MFALVAVKKKKNNKKNKQEEEEQQEHRHIPLGAVSAPAVLAHKH